MTAKKNPTTKKNSTFEVRRAEPEEVPKVAHLLDVTARLEAFKKLHAPIFTRYAELVSAYNDALEDAEKDVRARQIVVGPFELHSTYERSDGLRLYHLVGPETFQKLGGRVEQKNEYVIDKTEVQAALARGEISQDIYDQVISRVVAYRKPEPISEP